MFGNTANRIYRQAERNSVYLQYTCVGITQKKWDELMEGATTADRKRVKKILLDSEQLTKEELSWDYGTKYLKTETHLIRVWSAIEHFYKIK